MKDIDYVIDRLFDHPSFIELLKEVIEGQYDGNHEQQAMCHYVLTRIIRSIEYQRLDGSVDAMDAAKERRLLS